MRTIEVRAIIAHALPVAPIQLSCRLFDLELLRSECASGRNDRSDVPAIEIAAKDGAVVRGGNSHVCPVEMPRGNIDRQPVGELSGTLHENRFEIGTVWICRQHTAASGIKEENAISDGVLLRYGFGVCGAHGSNLRQMFPICFMEGCCRRWREARAGRATRRFPPWRVARPGGPSPPC